MVDSKTHEDGCQKVLSSTFRDDVSALGTEPMEIEANAFASELLIPAELLTAALAGSGVDMEDEAAVEALARRFRVSQAAMRFRLSQF